MPRSQPRRHLPRKEIKLHKLIDSDRRWLNGASDQQVAAAALISVESIAGPTPQGFTKRGQQTAMRNIKRELSLLPRHADPEIRAQQVLAAAKYTELVDAAMRLSPKSVLGDGSDGSNYPWEPYVPEDQQEEALSHTVFLPFVPGGFLYIAFRMMFWDDVPETEFDSPHLEYFPFNRDGIEADQLYNDDRNLACADIVTHHLRNVYWGPWSAQK